jgi:hypothetical protein
MKSQITRNIDKISLHQFPKPYDFHTGTLRNSHCISAFFKPWLNRHNQQLVLMLRPDVGWPRFPFTRIRDYPGRIECDCVSLIRFDSHTVARVNAVLRQGVRQVYGLEEVQT